MDVRTPTQRRHSCLMAQAFCLQSQSLLVRHSSPTAGGWVDGSLEY